MAPRADCSAGIKTEFTPLRVLRNRLAGRRQDRQSGGHAKPLRFQSSLLTSTRQITKECFMSLKVYVDNRAAPPAEIELDAEELEEVIAPGIIANHNETLVNDEVELMVEEIEEVIAPKLAANHNETIVTDEVELNAEELEEVITPGESLNHNETLIQDEIEPWVEEMEAVIAPLIAANHNETLVDDEVELNVEELEETIAPTPSIPIPPPLRNH